MEVILLERVKNLGDLGDIVRVRAGYGRNFLLPKGKALAATDSNRQVFEERRAELQRKAVEAKQAAQARAQKLSGKTVTVAAMAAEEGKLYGSVGPADIARAAAEAGLDLDKSEIEMADGPIRVIGTYDIPVRLHAEVETSISLVVVEENN